MNYLDHIGELMEQLSSRRIYGGRDDISLWTSVEITPDTQHVLQNISKVTTGRFLLLFQSVSFEDERDAVAFKLIN